MKSDSYLRFLLSDNYSLRKYYRERAAVDLQDVRRYMLLKIRELGYNVPDHYYRLGTEFSFSGIDELSKLFTIGLPKLVDEFLVIKKGQVFVKGEQMNEWQLLLPQIPPLLLVTMKIWKESGPIFGDVVDFAYRYLLPSVKNTAIPSPWLPEMETLRKENHGFDDLHIHLNGAVETDLAWHDFLRYPEVVYQDICKACHNDKVKEQFEQLTDISNPIEFYHLFCIAGRIREWLFHKVMNGNDIYGLGSFENLLSGFIEKRERFKEHPVKPILGNSASPLILEGLLYVKTLDYLAAWPHDEVVAGTFHYYLLILGVCNRLLVQQTDSFGFEQFQKYTSNNFREFSEQTYPQRFMQLAGNDLQNIRHIEGRFSPKTSVDDNTAIINKIVDGHNRLNQNQITDGIPSSTLSLVAHFIKRNEHHKGDIRFSKLRKDIDKRTDALIALMNTNSSYAKLIAGVDVAASEFDTPPVVHALNVDEVIEIAAIVNKEYNIFKWQLFQYMPIGPRGYAMRGTYGINNDTFENVKRKLLSLHFRASLEMEFKSVSDRVNKYILLGSDGYIWLPKLNEERTIIGHIDDIGLIEKIENIKDYEKI